MKLDDDDDDVSTGLNSMIVLFVKQVHLQNDVGSVVHRLVEVMAKLLMSRLTTRSKHRRGVDKDAQ